MLTDIVILERSEATRPKRRSKGTTCSPRASATRLQEVFYAESKHQRKTLTKMDKNNPPPCDLSPVTCPLPFRLSQKSPPRGPPGSTSPGSAATLESAIHPTEGLGHSDFSHRPISYSRRAHSLGRRRHAFSRRPQFLPRLRSRGWRNIQQSPPHRWSALQSSPPRRFGRVTGTVSKTNVVFQPAENFTGMVPGLDDYVGRVPAGPACDPALPYPQSDPLPVAGGRPWDRHLKAGSVVQSSFAWQGRQGRVLSPSQGPRRGQLHINFISRPPVCSMGPFAVTLRARFPEPRQIGFRKRCCSLPPARCSASMTSGRGIGRSRKETVGGHGNSRSVPGSGALCAGAPLDRTWLERCRENSAARPPPTRTFFRTALKTESGKSQNSEIEVQSPQRPAEPGVVPGLPSGKPNRRNPPWPAISFGRRGSMLSE